MLNIDLNRYSVIYAGEQLSCLECAEDTTSPGKEALEDEGLLLLKVVYLDDEGRVQCMIVQSSEIKLVEKSIEEQQAAQFHPWSLDDINQPPAVTTEQYINQQEGA